MNSRRKNILFLNMAVMLFGLSGVVSIYANMPAVCVTFGRVTFSVCILGIIILIKKESFKLSIKKDYYIAILAGLVLAVHWTSFFQSINVSSVAIGTITFSTYPLFVTFLEPIIFKEKLKVEDVFKALILLIGVLITIPEFSVENQITVGVLWGMLSSFTYAVLSLMNRHLTVNYSGVKICFYEQLTSCICLLPLVILNKVSLNTKSVMAVGFMGIFCTALAFTLFVNAQKSVKSQTAGIISGMETVYGILFAFVLFGQEPSFREIIGGLIILAVATLSSLKSGNIEEKDVGDVKIY